PASLDVEDVGIGGYIRGILGGERKEVRGGAGPYAGLRIEELREEGPVVKLRLQNLEKSYEIPKEVMARLGVDVYCLYYNVSPYRCVVFEALLGKEEKYLKALLQELLHWNESGLTKGDREKMERLREEVKTQLVELEKEAYYVLYRRSGAFTASVARGGEKEAVYDMLGYVKCRSKEQAYYYAGVLNYLAFCVLRSGRNFFRHTYLKPLEAVVRAGLSWKDVPEELRREVAGLSQEVEKEAPREVPGNQLVALKALSRNQKFLELVEKIDKYVEGHRGKGQLEEALDLVSTKPKDKRGKSARRRASRGPPRGGSALFPREKAKA
ncbi:MAG: hypothetical protein ABDH61_02545, partial [Acidilobaceae archaeon]